MIQRATRWLFICTLFAAWIPVAASAMVIKSDEYDEYYEQPVPLPFPKAVEIKPDQLGPGRLLMTQPLPPMFQDRPAENNNWQPRTPNYFGNRGNEPTGEGFSVIELTAPGSNACAPPACTRRSMMEGKGMPERLLVAPAAIPDFTRFAASNAIACGVAPAAPKRLHCWINDPLEKPYAELRGESGRRQQFDLPDDIIDVQLGKNHGCVLSAAGAVFCFGSQKHAQAGAVARETGWTSLVRAIHIPLSAPATALAVGQDGSCALVADQAWCWGKLNINGAWTGSIRPDQMNYLLGLKYYLGPPTPDAKPSKADKIAPSGFLLMGGTYRPQRIGNLNDIAQLAIGPSGLCALRRNGDLHCMPALQDRPADESDFDLIGSRRLAAYPGAKALTVGVSVCVLTAKATVECIGKPAKPNQANPNEEQPSYQDVAEIRSGQNGQLCLRYLDNRLTCGGHQISVKPLAGVADWGISDSLWLLTGRQGQTK